MKKISLTYVPNLKKYTATSVLNSPFIRQINTVLFPNDFWKRGSMFVWPEDMDKFQQTAAELGCPTVEIIGEPELV